MKKVCFIAVLLGAVLTACNSNVENDVLRTKGDGGLAEAGEPERPEHGYYIDVDGGNYISEEEATIILKDVFDASPLPTPDVATATVSTVYSEMFMYGADMMLTVMGNEEYLDTFHIVPEIVYYVYNFPEGGYAVINADLRNPQRFMYFSRNGCFDTEMFWIFNDLAHEYGPEGLSARIGRRPDLFDHDILELITMSWYDRLGLDEVFDLDNLAVKLMVKLTCVTAFAYSETVVSRACSEYDVEDSYDREVYFWHEGEPYNEYCRDENDEIVNAGNIPVITALLCGYTGAELEHNGEWWYGDLMANGDEEYTAQFISAIRNDLLMNTEIRNQFVYWYLPSLGFELTPINNRAELESAFANTELPLLFYDYLDGQYKIVVGYLYEVFTNCTYTLVITCVTTDVLGENEDPSSRTPDIISFDNVPLTHDFSHMSGELYRFSHERGLYY